MEERFHTLSRPYDGPAFFTVEQTTTALHNKVSLIRPVVRHPGGSLIAIIDEGHVVCIEQYRPAIGRKIIELPGGRPERGESPLETAKREAQEETGIIVKDVTLIGEFLIAPSFSDIKASIFIAKIESIDSQILDQSEFPITTYMVPLSELEELIQAAKITDCATIVGLFAARSYMAAGKSSDKEVDLDGIAS
jgi:ADP-ribose pyrophosphatase